MAKKKVSFIANGRRVTFSAKSTSKKSIPMRRKSSTASRRQYRIRRDTEQFVDAGLAYIHPALPLVKAGAKLMKDILAD